MIAIANTVAISLYLLAAALQAAYLLNISRQPKRSLLLLLGVIAVSAHAYSAIHTIYDNQLLDTSFFHVSSIIFWFVAAISLLSILRRPTSNLLIALFPLAAASILIAYLAPPSKDLANGISVGLFSHILTSILAYSMMTIAFIQATALALQERHLKHHHIGGILGALPPLQTMEQVLFELIWIGMVLLTLSLITGAIFIDDIFAQQLAHKTFFSILAWCIYAVLLWGRHQLGWRSQTAARWTFGGFVTLMLAYFGSKFVLELILNG
ncbi:MAG: cytochrome c biogenesis protein CcsA [Oceanicoccus sp.]